MLLGRHALVSWADLLLLAVSLVLLMRYRWHPAFVLVIGGVSGYLGLLR